MKEAELRKHADCSVCGRPIGASGLPLFWTVRLERWGLDVGAMARQDGLAALLGGSSRLAQVMGTNADMATRIGDPVVATVCETCAPKPVSVYELGLRED